MSLRTYLLGLSRLAAECAEDLSLLPSFVAILRLAPATISQLLRESRRLAA
jgi:hypothetical protein